MKLPLSPPLGPMLAKSVKGIPEGDYLYEPKWDGFRCIAFRDGDEVELSSRGEKPLTRYFPEVVEALKANLPERCVVDGEVVIATDDQLDFEALLQRIHPAESRVELLAEQTPGQLRRVRPARGRRRVAAPDAVRAAAGTARRRCSPTSAAGLRHAGHRRRRARRSSGSRSSRAPGSTAWSRSRSTAPTSPTSGRCSRSSTSARPTASWPATAGTSPGGVVGSLLLGLYDDDGSLQHVGVVGVVPDEAPRRAGRGARAVRRRGPRPATRGGRWAEADAQAAGRLPGAVSRWNAKKDLSWVPLRPELVVEVAYDHMEGTRFRHTAQLRRWRPDRDAAVLHLRPARAPRTLRPGRHPVRLSSALRGTARVHDPAADRGRAAPPRRHGGWPTCTATSRSTSTSWSPPTPSTTG